MYLDYEHMNEFHYLIPLALTEPWGLYHLVFVMGRINMATPNIVIYITSIICSHLYETFT